MTDGFKMGFINSEDKIEEIPKEYQEIIEHRDQLWIDMIKEIENKVGMVLDQLALTEKALELACEELYDHIAICNYCQHTICAECPNECPDSISLLIEYFKKNAKREIMKSE